MVDIYIGRNTFPDAKRILITCDCGGSNRSRGQQWKEQLARLSQLTGLEIYVSHFPTGCSKWNKVEHRLFSYISKSWQGHPLVEIEICVNLISNTTTEAGIKVICKVDKHKYELNKKLYTKKEFEALPIKSNGTLGKWNYIIYAGKNNKKIL